MKYEHSILERSTKSKVKPAVRGPLTRINGGTPALVPVVLYPIQIAALAFGGATLLNARGGVFCQGVLTGIFGAQFNALGCFLVQALGGAGGSAHIAQAQYHHGFELMALAHLHDIARLDFFGGLAVVSLTWTRPLISSSLAKVLVLKNLAAQSHLSMRMV